MNNKAQFELDEINPAFLGLSILGGLIGFFVASRASEGMVIPILSGVFSVIVCYIYLAATDQ